VVEALEVATLALPVADGVIDELKLAYITEVGDGEDRREDGLEAVVFALLRKLVHLQEALIAAALNLDEVRYFNCGWNFGKI
jgi:hypothetical protein